MFWIDTSRADGTMNKGLNSLHSTTNEYNARPRDNMKLYGVSRDLETATEGRVENGEYYVRNAYLEGKEDENSDRVIISTTPSKTNKGDNGQTSITYNKLPAKYKFDHPCTYNEVLTRLTAAIESRTLIIAFNFDTAFYKFKSPTNLRYSDKLTDVVYSSILTLLKDCQSLKMELMLMTSETDTVKIQERLDLCTDLGLTISYINGVTLLPNKSIDIVYDYHVLLDGRSGLYETFNILCSLISQHNSKKK